MCGIVVYPPIHLASGRREFWLVCPPGWSWLAGQQVISGSHVPVCARHVQMLRGAHASLVEQLARQVSHNPPVRGVSLGMQQKPSQDVGYAQWMADAQPLVGNLPHGVLAGSNESELSHRYRSLPCFCNL